MNSAKDGCECFPNELDDAAALGRTGTAILDTTFDMSASNPADGCKCNTGKYTSTSSGTLMCLECATSAGFLVDQTQLTDCKTDAQCEPRGFVGDVFEVESGPSVLCVCDTSKNFFDNKGGELAVEGCYCNIADNWWTLISGEYVEATGYDSNIDYTDLRNGFSTS